MVRHVVYGDQLILPGGDNASDVLLEFIVIFWIDQRLPAFDCEDDVDVNLGVGVGHGKKVPLLTELGNSIWLMVLQRYRPWPGLGIPMPQNAMTIKKSRPGCSSSVRSGLFYKLRVR